MRDRQIPWAGLFYATVLHGLAVAWVAVLIRPHLDVAPPPQSIELTVAAAPVAVAAPVTLPAAAPIDPVPAQVVPVAVPPRPPPPSPRRQVPAAVAAPHPEAAPAAVAQAAVVAAVTAPPDLGDAWRAALAAWLQAHKTYPEPARRAGIEGRAVLRFTLDRSGAVHEVTLLQSSGSTLLDTAATALLRGAMLPPPPAGGAETVTLNLPLRYSLER